MASIICNGLIVVPKELILELQSYLNKYGGITSTNESIRGQWVKGRRALDLVDDPKFTAGALRHSFALRLIKEGYSAPVVQAFLRHSTIVTTQHYFSQTQQDLLRIRDERSNVNGMQDDLSTKDKDRLEKLEALFSSMASLSNSMKKESTYKKNH